jgi:hypothetical protein
MDIVELLRYWDEVFGWIKQQGDRYRDDEPSNVEKPGSFCSPAFLA